MRSFGNSSRFAIAASITSAIPLVEWATETPAGHCFRALRVRNHHEGFGAGEGAFEGGAEVFGVESGEAFVEDD
jgi:hypothetical protein